MILLNVFNNDNPEVYVNWPADTDDASDINWQNHESIWLTNDNY